MWLVALPAALVLVLLARNARASSSPDRARPAPLVPPAVQRAINESDDVTAAAIIRAVARNNPDYSDTISARVLDYLNTLMTGLHSSNVAYLRAHPETPLLYRSGVRYNLDNDSRGIAATLQAGSGDCDEFASWRSAELEVRFGVPARPKVVHQHGQPPDRTHAIVQFPDGTLEDPSVILTYVIPPQLVDDTPTTDPRRIAMRPRIVAARLYLEATRAAARAEAYGDRESAAALRERAGQAMAQVEGRSTNAVAFA